MAVREAGNSKKSVELTGSTVTQNANGDDCIRTCGNMSITGGRAVSSAFSEITVNSTGWTSLVAPFSDILVLSVQNKSGAQIKLNPNNTEANYKGMTVEVDEERNYNDLDTGFVMYARAQTGTAVLNVEVLKNA